MTNSPRVQATVLHLALSLLLALLSVIVVFFNWYPTVWAQAFAVSEIFYLMLIIDVCIGPLLTLIVFKVGKPSLRLDLAVIITLQISALIYGLYTVGLGRPAYLVFVKNHFEVATAKEIYTVQGKGESATLIELNPWTQPLVGPVTVFAQESSDLELRNTLVFSMAGGGPSTHNVKDFYLPYAQALPHIQTYGRSLQKHEAKTPSKSTILSALKLKYPEDAVFVPLRLNTGLFTVLLHPTHGAILGIEPVDIFE
jgi:hypothetical protein